MILYGNEERSGGKHAKAYHQSYEMLVGMKIHHPAGVGFVAHFNMFKKSWVREIAAQIGELHGVSGKLEDEQWQIVATRNILSSRARETQSPDSFFADYEIVGSWAVTLKHPW